MGGIDEVCTCNPIDSGIILLLFFITYYSIPLLGKNLFLILLHHNICIFY